MSDERACCAHLRVVFKTRDDEQGITHGWWECDYGCGMHFTPMRFASPAPQPPVATPPTAAPDTGEAPSADTEDWPQRFAVYAFNVGGYDSLTEVQQEICDDAAEWARQRVAESSSRPAAWSVSTNVPPTPTPQSEGICTCGFDAGHGVVVNMSLCPKHGEEAEEDEDRAQSEGKE